MSLKPHKVIPVQGRLQFYCPAAEALFPAGYYKECPFCGKKVKPLIVEREITKGDPFQSIYT